MPFFKSKNAQNAFYIGFLCSVAYLAVYFARNILSAVTPQIIEGGIYDNEFIGSISSTYFILYAVGQLINGIIGDRIRARNMLSLGLVLAGVCNLLFPFVSTQFSAQVVYGLTGFFLSMIYAPMTRVVAENTEPIYATRCSLGYTFASFFGSPLAGAVAVFMTWQSVFITSSVVLFAMGVICFLVFQLFERKGIVRYGRFEEQKQQGGVKNLFKYNIVQFTFFSVVTGVIRTTVIFWFPTYVAQYLGYDAKESASIFTVATFIISFTTFITIFIYERLHSNMELTILLMFTASTLAFLAVYLVKQPILNIVLLVIAIMASNGAATMIWSRYCPSLRDTGMVSSATGFLDFMSYMAASASSTIFANSVSTIGWGNLILVWMGLMIAGVAVTLTFGKKRLFPSRKAN